LNADRGVSEDGYSLNFFKNFAALCCSLLPTTKEHGIRVLLCLGSTSRALLGP